MFIGGGLTVQNATEIRDDLTILDSDIVMTDQYGNEEPYWCECWYAVV